MSVRDQEALQLCESGLQHLWSGAVDAAIETYDRALTRAESDDVRELVTIRKAEALIAAELEGPEVSALPAIVMRRRSPRHVYLAAYALMRRHADAEDRKRAQFYGEIARKAAAELDDPFARANVLNGLGVILVADSQFKAGADAFMQALYLVDDASDSRLRELAVGITANLGGTKILMDQPKDGIGLIESVLRDLTVTEDRAEAMLDLALGYMNLEQYATAESFVRSALELATSRRQTRNANYVLGEICIRTSRYEEADGYFDVVASYYPDFKNVKQLLVAVDLCSVVNWKA
jgi:tetratricopeptide (TPR) repeat protein